MGKAEDDAAKAEPGQVAANASAKIKNTGIRHRLMNDKHGNHVIEKGEVYELPLDTAIMLLLDHEEFDLVSVSGASEKDVRAQIEAEKKVRHQKREQRAKMLAEEQAELEAAEEASSRASGN